MKQNVIGTVITSLVAGFEGQKRLYLANYFIEKDKVVSMVVAGTAGTYLQQAASFLQINVFTFNSVLLFALYFKNAIMFK